MKLLRLFKFKNKSIIKDGSSYMRKTHMAYGNSMDKLTYIYRFELTVRMPHHILYDNLCNIVSNTYSREPFSNPIDQPQYDKFFNITLANIEKEYASYVSKKWLNRKLSRDLKNKQIKTKVVKI